jgi:hypothetical protein
MNKWSKPTQATKFHIDFDWWDEQGRNFRVHLLSHLCDDCRARFSDHLEAEMIDWVDADTARVTRVDGLWHSLRTCCSLKPDYVNDRTPLTTAVFRSFLANGNQPLTAEELSKLVHRPADTILKTIGGFRVHRGIKPVVERQRGRGS